MPARQSVAETIKIMQSLPMAGIPHIIFDNFLPESVHRALLEHVLNVDDFALGKILIDGTPTYQPNVRKGRLSNDKLGPHLEAFRSALRSRFVEICAGLGMEQFPLAEIEIRLAAHHDGDFFKPHRDTLVGGNRTAKSTVRMITAVYYLHRQPRGFDGGELQLHPFGDGQPLQIEPADNRLAIFPSMLLHEVLPVTVASGDFRDSRFSVSCWFDRLLPNTGNKTLP